jgi:hypothetical protein
MGRPWRDQFVERRNRGNDGGCPGLPWRRHGLSAIPVLVITLATLGLGIWIITRDSDDDFDIDQTGPA